MNHNKVAQQLGDCHRIVANQKNQALFDQHPSSHPNIHLPPERCLGMRFFFQQLRGDGFLHQVMRNSHETNQSM
jgi:hypothetical protein